MRKPRKLTNQEALVTAFSEHSISAGSTFHPQQWSSGKEPADMVIALGRSVLMFNMTASKSYWQDMVDHNTQQAYDRIAEWSAGRQLRGHNVSRTFAVGWDDVDHVGVVCVVDGPHAACSLITVPLAQKASKVRVCLVVTSDFLNAFANLGGGARDLLRFSRIHLRPEPITSAHAVSALRAYYEIMKLTSGNAGLPEPKRIGRAIIHGREVSWFDEQCATLISPRQHQRDHLGVFSDFSWQEIFDVAAFVIASVCEMEALAAGQIRAAAIGQNSRIFAVVSSNQEGLTEKTPELIERSRAAECSVIYNVGLTSIGLLCSFGVDAAPSTWALDQDLSAYRGSAQQP